MASPLDLASFGGFNCFGIESNDICDDAGAVFLLQMCKKNAPGRVSICSYLNVVCVRVLVVCLALTYLLAHHFLLDYSSMLQYLHFCTQAFDVDYHAMKRNYV